MCPWTLTDSCRMGTAWNNSSAYPWETTRYVSGIEVVKVNITLRIYAAKWHVYAGLAMLNPSAQSQIQQYARSTTELFQLMLEGRTAELSARVWKARQGVFGWKEDEEGGQQEGRAPILLSEDILDQFSLGQAEGSRESPNSHLSLMAMVDCWNALGIRPFEHLDVAGTPVFMLWIGESRAVIISNITNARRPRRRGVFVPVPKPHRISYRGRHCGPRAPLGRRRVRCRCTGLERVC